jgi:dUTP pyrophosphatase
MQPQLPSLNILRFSPEAKVPTRAHPDDAGLDLYGLEDVLLEPGEGKMVRTGVGIALPHGFMGMVADRSSMGKRGVKTAGGIIDSGYRGEVHVILWNVSREQVRLKAGERIAQLIVYPIVYPEPVEVGEFEQTNRGAKGFGSSGK